MDNPSQKREEIIPVDIEDTLKSSFLDYAMSVIISRALPDVRDGLKPVHRRILYAMYNTGNTHNKPYRKSARIAGDVIGKYHPHGEAAVYDAIVRMAQDFSMRYPLVDGQGNFGSIDGDPPAAMRYTEVRMTKLAEELLQDIEKETVDFVPNYDNSLLEPTVLPAKFPNLLVNGSTGIAVGMATNIPPHNLGEVIDTTIRVIEEPDVEVEELIKILQGPDFPTGGIIYGRDGILKAYKTGRGGIRVRGTANIEKLKGEREAIVITEIPYQVNKSSLLEEIAEYIRERKIDAVSDLRDESDRSGMRIVIELRKGANPQLILNQLYKHTKLEIGYQILLLAIKDNIPQVLTLKDLISAFIEARRKVIIRRTIFDLEAAKKKAHILEGLTKSLDHLDEVISIIRESASSDEARQKLETTLELTTTQAEEILALRLSRLTQLEREKIINELAETRAQIDWLTRLLGNEALIKNEIKKELEEIRKNYADARKTRIVDILPELAPEDLIEDKEMVISATLGGYLKRTPLDQYRSQRRGGKGITAMSTKDEDIVTKLYTATSHDKILFFTRRGLVFSKKVWEIPEFGRSSKGTPIVNLVGMPQDDSIASIITLREFSADKDLFFVSRRGYVKRLSLGELENIRRNGLRACAVEPDDELVEVELLDNTAKNLLIVTRHGKAISFNYDEVRRMGRNARGVIGIRLTENDRVVALTPVIPDHTLLIVTANGYGKRTRFEEFPIHHRGGRGIISARVTMKTGAIVGGLSVADDDEIMIITTGGTLIRMKTREIPLIGRATQGVRLINLEHGEEVSGVAIVVEKED